MWIWGIGLTSSFLVLAWLTLYQMLSPQSSVPRSLQNQRPGSSVPECVKVQMAIGTWSSLHVPPGIATQGVASVAAGYSTSHVSEGQGCPRHPGRKNVSLPRCVTTKMEIPWPFPLISNIHKNDTL